MRAFFTREVAHRPVLVRVRCHLPPPTALLPGDSDGRGRRQKQAQRYGKAVGVGMRGPDLAPAAVGCLLWSYPHTLAPPRDGQGTEEAGGGSESEDAAKSRPLEGKCVCFGLDPDWTTDCRIAVSHRKPRCYRYRSLGGAAAAESRLLDGRWQQHAMDSATHAFSIEVDAILPAHSSGACIPDEERCSVRVWHGKSEVAVSALTRPPVPLCCACCPRLSPASFVYNFVCTTLLPAALSSCCFLWGGETTGTAASSSRPSSTSSPWSSPSFSPHG